MHGLQQLVLGGIHGAVLLIVEADDHEVGIALRQQFGQYAVDGLQRNHRNHLLHHLIGVLQAGHRLIAEEVVECLTIELAVGALVASLPGLVEARELVLLEAVVFGCGEAVLGSLLHNEVGGLEGIGRQPHIFR